MISNKKNIQILAAVLLQKGITDIVISPGSRNAPLINTFTGISDFKCINIVDERSAAFFALGISQLSRKPVAIVSTSGTAVLNYAPAIAEAYYQKLPLLVLTADRPADLIDKGDGQTIRQDNIYQNYIKGSFSLPQAIDQPAIQMISQAVDTLEYPEPGPVHINIPLEEPLYDVVDERLPDVSIPKPLNKKEVTSPDTDLLTEFSRIWNNTPGKLIISGQDRPGNEHEELLQNLSEIPGIAVLTETTSNINGKLINTSIDNIMATIKGGDLQRFQPDLLITFGGQIVSKKIKVYLRQYQPQFHWHFSPSAEAMDTFNALTHVIDTAPGDFFNGLLEKAEPSNSGYHKLWNDREAITRLRHDEFLANCRYSDLKAFEKILAGLPHNSIVHLSNSTPVRYNQLFRMRSDLKYMSNRGTSGIDGVVSTAAGTAYAARETTTLITGDLAFFYDSNGLWNQYLVPELKIIMINNGGGGIFRFIEGPDDMPALEKHFEARHNYTAKHLATAFGLSYRRTDSLTELETAVDWLYNQENDRPVILEVFTPGEENAVVLKDYFKFLK